MTMPQDTQGDPLFQGLDQDALNAALDTYNQSTTRYNTAGQNYDAALAKQQAITNSPGTTNSVDAAAADSALTTASNQLSAARTQLGSDSRSYSSLMGRLAVANHAKALKTTDPAQRQYWEQKGTEADAHAKYYAAESDLHAAKTQADIEKATGQLQVAQQNSARLAQIAPSTIAKNGAQALLADAHAADVPALDAATIRVRNSQVERNATLGQKDLAGAAAAAARASYTAGALTNKTQAQAEYISGPQAEAMYQRGELLATQKDYIVQSGGAKIQDLIDKGLLDQTRAAQIRANMNKWNVVPGADSKNPTLVQQQASTGELQSVTNPGYVNPQLQTALDREAAIKSTQADLAAGKITVSQANQRVDAIAQASAYQQLGMTPQQYQQEQDAQKTAGEATLTGMQTQGREMGTQLLTAADKARTPIAMSPYEDAQAMGGGQAALQQAFAMIGQVKPITDRMSAIVAAGKWAEVKQLLDQAKTTPDPGAPAVPAAAAAATSPTAAMPSTNGLAGMTPATDAASRTPIPQQQPNFAAQSINDPGRSNTSDPSYDPLAMQFLQAASPAGMP